MSSQCFRAAVAVFLFASSGCGEAGGPSAPGDDSGPRYAVESLTFGDAGSFSYINFIGSLETQEMVRLAGAREFAAYAPADAWNGKIIVGSGEGPELTRYAVSGAAWTEEQTIDFGAYASGPLQQGVYLSATKALVPFDGTNHVLWNPTTFTLGAEIGAPPAMPLTRGASDELLVSRGYSHELRGARLYQPYYWADASFHAYSQLSQIAVIDTDADRVAGVLDASCPHLHITSQDDAGNLYFSNGTLSISSAVLTPGAPKNCFVRVNAGEETVDPTSLTYFSDLAGGREGSNLFTIGGGKALFNVYHAERDGLTADTPFATVDYSSSYHLWTLDLATMQASMMEGIDFSGGQAVTFRIDGRVFVTIPAGDYSSTAVYEVLPSGRAEKRFDVEGWAFKMFRVR